MNVQLWSRNVPLYETLAGSGRFNVSKFDGESVTGDTDVLVVDGKDVSYLDLKLVLQKRAEPIHCFYILTEAMLQQREEIEASLNVRLLPPFMTESQITDAIVLETHHDATAPDSKVHVFFGADSKVGTTMTVDSVGEYIARHSQARVLVVHLESPVQYMDDLLDGKGAGMDHLKFRLFNDILDSEEFKKAAYKGKYDNLFFVQGPSIISDLRYYQPRHVETIVRLAAADYDIILIDAGSNVERGLCIGALRSSPYRYAVTTQQAHVKDRFLRLADQIFLPMQIDRDTMQLIVNKHVPSNIRDKQIEEVYGAKILAEIPHLDFKGWQAEVETKTLLGQEPRYDAAVAAIAKTITERQEIPLEAESMGIRAKLGRWMR